MTGLAGGQIAFGFAGAAIAELIPITDIAGNSTISFGVMSYAGTIVIVVVADPDRHPDLDTLAMPLQSALDDLPGENGQLTPIR